MALSTIALSIGAVCAWNGFDGARYLLYRGGTIGELEAVTAFVVAGVAGTALGVRGFWLLIRRPRP